MRKSKSKNHQRQTVKSRASNIEHRESNIERRATNDERREMLHGQDGRVTVRSYDAAAINRHNQLHWLHADGRDADSLIFGDLATLRNRARYEIRNNSYAKGVVETKASDFVGTGPRLQISTDDSDIDSIIEDKFNEWCEICDLAGKLGFADIISLTGSKQLDESGESLIVFQNRYEKQDWFNAQPQVSLKLSVIEPDRLMTPLQFIGSVYNDRVREGIEVDEFGRPLNYYILNKHPGSMFNFDFGSFTKVPASQVIHLYRQDRPGQSRGVPWLTPALSLFAYLRRFTIATIESAESAANISGILESEQAGDEADQIAVGDEVEIPRNSLLTTAAGQKLSQLKPEQPATTYDMFKREILNEIGRCLNMPYNVIAANSSDYNYASGRLDWQVYYKFIKTVRGWIERIVLNRIFWTWFREAILVTGYFGRDLKTTIKIRNLSKIKPQWFWPGSEHVDPLKEANAQKIRLLENKTTTYAYEYAMQGKDWEREFRQIAKEQKLMSELGIKVQSSKSNNQSAKDETSQNGGTPNRKLAFTGSAIMGKAVAGRLKKSGDNGNE